MESWCNHSYIDYYWLCIYTRKGNDIKTVSFKKINSSLICVVYIHPSKFPDYFSIKICISFHSSFEFEIKSITNIYCVHFCCSGNYEQDSLQSVGEARGEMPCNY